MFLSGRSQYFVFIITMVQIEGTGGAYGKELKMKYARKLDFIAEKQYYAHVNFWNLP